MEVSLISKTQGLNEYSLLDNNEIIAAIARHGVVKMDGGKLVKYLMDNAHWSPLQHISFGFKIETRRSISAQIFRHRSLNGQEWSLRYDTPLGFEEIDSTVLTASLNIDFIRHDTTRKCFVIGEKGTLLWDGIKGQVKFFEKSSKHWKILFVSNPDRNFTYIEEIKSFFLSVENNIRPSITGEDGLQTVNIVESIKRSSIENSVVFCQK